METGPAAVLYGALLQPPRRSAAERAEAVDCLDAALHDAAAAWGAGGCTIRAPDPADGPFMVVLADAACALRVALYLRARLRAGGGDADASIAIGLGALDGIQDEALRADDAPPPRGRAVDAARRGFDTMPRHAHLTVIAAGAGSRVLSGWLACTGELLDALVRRWTARQAEIVSLAIAPGEPRYEDVARQLGITKQAVSKALASAGWAAVRGTLRVFEAADWRVSGAE